MPVSRTIRMWANTCLKVMQGGREYYSQPMWRSGFGGPFNGQRCRQELFLELVRAFRVVALVETGTYRGTTTEFMRQMTDLAVFSTDLDPRAYGFARMRFLGRRGVHLFLRDSRSFLRELARHGPKGRVLFYLDAHWNKDLPLREEVDVIFRAWPQAVVMIDDFQVPDDTGFGFDDYGPGKALTLEYLGDLKSEGLQAFFPAIRSSEETGARRGAVVLASDPDVAAIARRLKSLRSAEP